MITIDPGQVNGAPGRPTDVGAVGGALGVGGSGVEGSGETADQTGLPPTEARPAGGWSRAGKDHPAGRPGAGGSARRGRMRASDRARDGYDALIWLVLIAMLAFYGWYAASLQPPVEEPAPTPISEPISEPDMAVQGMAAETADLERQLAEAEGRIAALEQTLSEEREPIEAPREAPEEMPPSAPSLITQVVELGGRQTEQGLLLELPHSDLTFPIGQSTLPPGDQPILDRIAALLLQHPTAAARVEGHTDSAGRSEVNLTLSQERADAVKEALVRRDVDAGRILAVGYGETRPIADNGSRAGRDRNRRIEIHLTEGPK